MRKNRVKRQEEQDHLKLGFWHIISHFSVVPFLLIVPCLSAIDLYKVYVTHTYKGLLTPSALITSSLPFIVVALFAFFLQRHRLKFKKIEIPHSKEDFQEAVRRTAEKYEWQIEFINHKFFRAHRPFNWTGSWGEMITIIRDGDKLLFNSICDPSTFPSIISYGWNKKNFTEFYKNLRAVVSGEPIESAAPEEAENEWSLKKILIRIIAYPFCLCLIAFSLWVVIPAGKVIPGILAITIALIYLAIDLRMAFSKK